MPCPMQLENDRAVRLNACLPRTRGGRFAGEGTGLSLTSDIVAWFLMEERKGRRRNTRLGEMKEDELAARNLVRAAPVGPLSWRAS